MSTRTGSFLRLTRLANYLIRDWRRTHGYLISQRGWVDNYIFGAVQENSYEETETLLRTGELEKAAAIIFLIADPEVAFRRIQGDPDADKYETLEFLEAQYRETQRFLQAVRAGDPFLAPFLGVPTLLIDTTERSEDEVCLLAERFLNAPAS